MLTFQQIIENRYFRGDGSNLIQHCSTCARPTSSFEPFLVAKSFSGGRCVLEAAQCMACQQQGADSVSEQSLENLMLYSGRKLQAFVSDPFQRKLYHLEDPHCLITGENLALSDHFELYTLSGSGFTDSDENFFFIGPTAMEQMGELLSKETRKNWEDFISELTPDVPEAIISPMFMR